MNNSLRQLAISVRIALSDRRIVRVAIIAGWIYVALAVLVDGYAEYARFFTAHDIRAASIEETFSDHDYINPLAQLATHPRFRDTMIWWTHNWIGEYRNWRPLACQFFWVEYKLFGPYRFDEFSAVALASHLLAVAALAWFVKELTGSRPTAALTALLFAGSRHFFPLNYYHLALCSINPPPADVCLGKWKDTVDFWYTACLFASGAFALRGQWAWSVVLAFMSPCFKETGWLVYPANLLVVALQGRIRQIPVWCWIASTLSVLLLLYFRCLAGTNVMAAYTVGHNTSWWLRYYDAVAGVYVQMLPIRPYIPLLATALTIICLIPGWRILARLLAAIVATSLACFLGSLRTTDSALASFATLLDPRANMYFFIACLLWSYGFYVLAMDKQFRKLAPAILFLRLAAGATLVITLAIGRHVMYLSEAYAAIVAAMIVVAIARRYRKAYIGWLEAGLDDGDSAPLPVAGAAA